MSDSFNDFFDFNHDGKLDALEWSAKMEFLDEVCKELLSSNTGAGWTSRRPFTRSSRLAYGTAGTSSGSRASQKKEEKSDPLVGFMLKLLLVAVCVLIGYRVYKVVRHFYNRTTELGRLKNLVEEYEKRATEELPAYILHQKKRNHMSPARQRPFRK